MTKLQILGDRMMTVAKTYHNDILANEFARVGDLVAHQSGITEEAYADRSVVDAHIVTALKQMFPNAEFKDTYSY